MQDFIEQALETARKKLFTGMQVSKQASYARRAPHPESLPYFREAGSLLMEILKEAPSNRSALMMMSQICEILLDYHGAIDYLNKAIGAGEPRTKKVLKRLALLRESGTFWQDLLLTPAMLRELGFYLERMGVGPQHRSLDFTREWLTAHVDKDPERFIAALERQGAFSDFQVLANIVKA